MESTQAVPVKRGRGRPKKAVAGASNNAGASNGAQPVAKQEVSKRGRKPGAKTASKPSKPAPAASAVKRGRGRPKKSETEKAKTKSKKLKKADSEESDEPEATEESDE